MRLDTKIIIIVLLLFVIGGILISNIKFHNPQTNQDLNNPLETNIKDDTPLVCKWYPPVTPRYAYICRDYW